MSNFVDSTFWLFLALGWGFALITILLSWWRVDHGLAEVLAARRACEGYATQVEELKQILATLPGEWPAIYIGLRRIASGNVTDGESLRLAYFHGVQRHSKHHDIEMVFPVMKLPPELDPPDPPPLPPLIESPSREEKESAS